MSGINFQASFHNLTQVEQLQQQNHQTPAVQHHHNAEAAQKEASLKAKIPTPPDKSENKLIDTNAQRQRTFFTKKRKEKKKKKNADRTRRNRKRVCTGGCIDYDA